MESDTPTLPDVHPPAHASPPSRRGFLAGAVTLAGAAVALLVPAMVGIVAALNPLRQKGSGGRDLPLASLDSLPVGGPPQRVPVIADRTDAWNRFPDRPIGAVWLLRTGPKTVRAFNERCPHAGCPVVYRGADDPDQNKRNRFACPCHTAIFELDGELLAGVPSDSPRPLDELTWRIENGREVWVEFQDFQAGITTKVPRA